METKYAERFKILGRNIAFYRKQMGYTQETLAECIDKTAEYIAKIEGQQSVRGVSLNTLYELAEALGVPPGQLLDGR